MNEVKHDHGEDLAIEISYPDLWKMTNSQAYVVQHLGAHKRYLFKNATVYESPTEDGKTILMMQEHKS